MNRLVTWLWGRLPLTKRGRYLLVWAVNAKFTVGVVGLVRDDEGRILLMRHTYRPRAPWGLPGGGLQPRETLEECLRREIREEAGLEIEIEGIFSVTAHSDRRLVDVIYACRLAAGQGPEGFKPNAEVSEIGFFDPAAMPREMSRGQRRLIGEAYQRLDSLGRTFAFEPGHDEWP